jgi:hypothetical protein
MDAYVVAAHHHHLLQCLLPDNYRPEGDEVLFYANSRQRTFATAKYFSAGFLPFANVEITPEGRRASPVSRQSPAGGTHGWPPSSRR